jgi:alanine dehydrogenase
MNIGIPTEIKPDERRVALTLSGARELNHRRKHQAIGRQPPITRLNNPLGSYT